MVLGFLEKTLLKNYATHLVFKQTSGIFGYTFFKGVFLTILFSKKYNMNANLFKNLTDKDKRILHKSLTKIFKDVEREIKKEKELEEKQRQIESKKKDYRDRIQELIEKDDCRQHAILNCINFFYHCFTRHSWGYDQNMILKLVLEKFYPDTYTELVNDIKIMNDIRQKYVNGCDSESEDTDDCEADVDVIKDILNTFS